MHTCQICFATNSHRTDNCPNQVQRVVVQTVQPVVVVIGGSWNPNNTASAYGIRASWRC